MVSARKQFHIRTAPDKTKYERWTSVSKTFIRRTEENMDIINYHKVLSGIISEHIVQFGLILGYVNLLQISQRDVCF